MHLSSVRSAWLRHWKWIVLIGVTLLAYSPAWHGGMLWDDDDNLLKPDLASWHGLLRIWTEPGATQQYYPLTYSVFWGFYQFFGRWTFPYHLLSLGLHCGSVLLVVSIARRLRIPGAFLAGALFALHPIEVQSVAWISEVKNVLSGFLFFASLRAYLEFDERRKPAAYALAALLFLGALCAKTVTAMLAPDLLIVLWWSRGRLEGRRDLLPLLPFFLVGIGMGLLTAFYERTLVQADFVIPWSERFLVAGHAFWFYLAKLSWPFPLIFFYPKWDLSHHQAAQALFSLAAAAFLLVLWIRRERLRGALAAFFFYAVTLFPVLGFLNVYRFRFSYVSDHFQYLAGVAILVLASAGAARWAERTEARQKIARVGAFVLLGFLALLTVRQCLDYTASEVLYESVLELNPTAWIAENNLAHLLTQRGDFANAETHARRALALYPDYAEAHYNLGLALSGESGFQQEALEQFEKAVTLDGTHAESRLKLGEALLAQGRSAEALPQGREAVRLRPKSPEAWTLLGDALLETNQWVDAADAFQTSLQLRPDASVCANLGTALLHQGKAAEAMASYRQALGLDSDNVWALLNLSWIESTSPDPALRNGASAAALATQANVLTQYKYPMAWRALAAALAEQGRFPEAVAAVNQALSLLGPTGSEALRTDLREQAALYASGQPFRDRSALRGN